MLEGGFFCKFIHTCNKTVASIELKHISLMAKVKS